MVPKSRPAPSYPLVSRTFDHARSQRRASCKFSITRLDAECKIVTYPSHCLRRVAARFVGTTNRRDLMDPGSRPAPSFSLVRRPFDRSSSRTCDCWINERLRRISALAWPLESTQISVHWSPSDCGFRRMDGPDCLWPRPVGYAFDCTVAGSRWSRGSRSAPSSHWMRNRWLSIPGITGLLSSALLFEAAPLAALHFRCAIRQSS